MSFDLTRRMSFEEFAVAAGQAFQSIEYVSSLLVPRYWRITMPPDHSVFLQTRDISGDIGPIIYGIYPNASGISDNGQPVPISNRRVGGRQSGAIIQPVTVSDPGSVNVLAIARGTATGEGSRQSQPAGPGADTIYLQGQVVVVGVTAPETVPNFKLEYKWIEMEPLEAIDD